MKHIEQVIILGAGASTSDGMPMQNELFEVFFKKRSKFEDIKKSKKIIYLLEGQEKLIKKFFDDFWGIDIGNFGNKENFPTFEECLGMLDLANIQGQSFKEYDQEMINKIRNALIFLISDLLNDRELKDLELYLFCWDEIPDKDKGSLISFLKQNFDVNLAKTAQIKKIDSTTIKISDEKNDHSLKLNDKNSKINIKFDDVRIDEFIVKKEKDRLNIYKKLNHKRLIERLNAENKLNETAFISLNYDILIDNAVMSCPEFNIDYGIEFINHKRPQDADKSVLLLKPHGSLNWLYCPTCNHIKLFPKENRLIDLFLDFLKKISCENCGTPLKDVIVPMTYFKEISNPFIQQIFLKADDILRQADKIFICGYSFPDADIHIKYLLKRAERFNGKTPEIFVINNYKGKKLRQKKDEKQRFTRFFKNKDKIHYTNKSFQDFVEEGI